LIDSFKTFIHSYKIHSKVDSFKTRWGSFFAQTRIKTKWEPWRLESFEFFEKKSILLARMSAENFPGERRGSTDKRTKISKKYWK